MIQIIQTGWHFQDFYNDPHNLNRLPACKEDANWQIATQTAPQLGQNKIHLKRLVCKGDKGFIQLHWQSLNVIISFLKVFLPWKSLDKFDLCQGARQLAKDLDFFIRWRCIEPERPIEIGAVRSKSRPRRQLLAQFLQQELLYYTASTTLQYWRGTRKGNFQRILSRRPLSFRNQHI